MHAMADKVSVVMVEDSAADASLVERELRHLGYPLEVRRVCSEDQLRVALDRPPDLVLSDHSMPGFSGLEALRIVREVCPGVPFIFVSGTLVESQVRTALVRGAADYLSKDELYRLPAVAKQAVDLLEHRQRIRAHGKLLAQSERRLRALVDVSREWVFEVDGEGRFVFSNGRGPAAEHVGANGEDFWAAMCPKDRSRMQVALRELRRSELELSWCAHRSDGAARHFEGIFAPRHGEDGRGDGFYGIAHDATERLADERRLRMLARYHDVLGNFGSAALRAHDLRALLELACRLAVTPGDFAAAVIGVPTDEGRLHMTAHAGDEDVVAFVERLGDAALHGPVEQRRPVARVFLSNAREVGELSAYQSAHPEISRSGVASYAVLPIGEPAWAVLGLYSRAADAFDPAELVLLERFANEIDYAREFLLRNELLEERAFRSAAAHLPNRAALTASLQPLWEEVPPVLAALEIERFREQVSARGRGFGNALLAAAGQRLREHFTRGFLLCHVESESFLVAVVGLEPAAASEAIIDGLAAASLDPLRVHGESFPLTWRAGLACAPHDGANLDELEHAALMALHAARVRREPWLHYDAAMRAASARRERVERCLRSAVAEEELQAHLQPRFQAKTRRLVGAELLLRWTHAELGNVSPGEFVPILEETGLILSVGRQVMQWAARILDGWASRGLQGYTLAVNVSALELRNPGFIEQCRRVVPRAAAGNRLGVEVTETELMHDIDGSVRTLQGLRGLGFEIAIDDFGTGYSSLAYLSRLPVDVLKIDRSFIGSMTESPDTLALVRNVITLAHSLQVSVVAEGVETEEQEGLLRLLRCDELQGFHLGRPVPLETFERLYLT